MVNVRLRFLGKVLSVERASKVTEERKRQHGEMQTGKDAASLIKNVSSAEKLDGNARGGEPIAEKLGVNYPFPPHLEYVLQSAVLGLSELSAH